ncbi:unnamed protein product [marine sediment metagenome]|uniref:Uncharacterized protein n=1 Tax=marine sediment metagenome TaxID=412755 RepID=X0W4Z7_9ZZZZ
MYRPEGMRDNPFTIEKGNLSPDAETEANTWEVGADAMLEGLKKEGENKPKEWVDDMFGLHTTGGGYLVFIPEEEE